MAHATIVVSILQTIGGFNISLDTSPNIPSCIQGIQCGVYICETCLISYRYGEIVNINLVRDKTSGKSKGFCFLCYEDQRSTILAVDNFNGIKVISKGIVIYCLYSALSSDTSSKTFTCCYCKQRSMYP